MGAAEAEELLETELTTLDVRDGAAVRALAARVEALGDTARISQVCARSNAVRAAVGRLRADALATLLARDEGRDEFIRRTADREYMAAVELDALRVPRYVAIEPFACPCGAALLVPYPKQGGPGFCFDCPACAAPYLARLAYGGCEYRAEIEADTRPAKKRKKQRGVL